MLSSVTSSSMLAAPQLSLLAGGVGGSAPADDALSGLKTSLKTGSGGTCACVGAGISPSNSGDTASHALRDSR